MDKIFSTEVFFGLNVLHILLIGAGWIGFEKLLEWYKSPARQRVTAKACTACPWTGVTEKTNFACPKCKAQLKTARK